MLFGSSKPKFGMRRNAFDAGSINGPGMGTVFNTGHASGIEQSDGWPMGGDYPGAIDERPTQPETGMPTVGQQFKRPSVGRNIAGTIGDALMQWGGMQPMYAPMMQQRREFEMRDSLAKQKLYEPQQVGSSIIQKSRDGSGYDTLFTAPSDRQPYRWRANNGDLMGLGEDGQPYTISKDPTAKMQWVRADNGDGTFTMTPVPMGGSVAGTSASDDEYYDAPPEGSIPYTGGQGAGNFSFDKSFNALVGIESGGRRGVSGTATQYGTARGLTQVLPSTGKQMARRIGIPWRPDLMVGKSDEAANYQLMIGREYFKEAWKATGGDPRAAAMYYHGGPDRSIWGPKTRRHGDKLINNLNRGRR